MELGGQKGQKIVNVICERPLELISFSDFIVLTKMQIEIKN